MKKMWKMAAAAGMTVMVMTGCALNTGARVYDNEKALSGQANSYNLVNYKGSHSGDMVGGSAKLLEGVDTIWEYDADETEEAEITYSLNVTSGKAKLVYVDPDGNVSLIVECSEEDGAQSGTESVAVKEGRNRIRLVGAQGTGLEYEFAADKGEAETFGG